MTTRNARLMTRLYEGTAGSVGLVENPNPSAVERGYEAFPNAKVNAKPNTKSKRVVDSEFAKSKRLKTALDNQILYREYYLERAELRRRLIYENSLALAIIWDKYNFA